VRSGSRTLADGNAGAPAWVGQAPDIVEDPMTAVPLLAPAAPPSGTPAPVTALHAVGSRGPVAALSPREREVLFLLADGLSNREIAGRLYVSEATVKTHVGAIFAKLGARDRAAAIVFAYDHGIVGIPPGADPT
jgi:DNA-binding NarL/FixJ family response regulator